MVGVVERRVPERHDRVAHIFVDRALVLDDRVGHRRQEAVHQLRQALRVVLVGFRDRGEAAHVAEHDGHGPRLAAEHELLRRLRELLDEGGRQILAEGRADAPPVLLLAHIADEFQREVDQEAREQREAEIDQDAAALVKRYQDRPVTISAIAANRTSSAPAPSAGASSDSEQAGDERDGELGDGRPVRMRQHRTREHRFENLRMDLDAGHRRIERRGLDVEQADGRCADQHELAGEPVGWNAPFEHVLGRHVARRIVRAEMDPELAGAVGRDFEAGHRDALHAGGVGADQDGAGIGDHAQHVERQRRRDDAAGASPRAARGARCRRARCGW